jgi:hypothetical protein
MHLQVIKLTGARDVFLSELVSAPGHREEDGRVSLVDVLEQHGKVGFFRDGVGRWGVPQLVKGFHVPGLD